MNICWTSLINKLNHWCTVFNLCKHHWVQISILSLENLQVLAKSTHYSFLYAAMRGHVQIYVYQTVLFEVLLAYFAVCCFVYFLHIKLFRLIVLFGKPNLNGVETLSSWHKSEPCWSGFVNRSLLKNEGNVWVLVLWSVWASRAVSCHIIDMQI